MPYIDKSLPFIGPFVGVRLPPIPRGLTLAELVITLAVVGVLTAAAAPGFISLVEGTRTTAAANDLLTHIQIARGSAIARNAEVILCRSVTAGAVTPACGPASAPLANNYSDGWIVYVNTAGNSNYEPALGDELLNRFVGPGADRIQITSNTSSNNWLIYGPDGLLNAATAGAYAVCDRRGVRFAKLVTVPLTGRPRIGPVMDSDDCPA